jgi:hypothetical protein
MDKLIFIFAGLVTSLIILLCFYFQRDKVIINLSRKRFSILFSIALSIWLMQFLLLFFGTWLFYKNDLTIPTFNFIVVLVIWLLFSFFYVKYQQFGVLGLHCGGVLMFGIYLTIIFFMNGDFFIPIDKEDFYWKSGISIYLGSVISVPYALISNIIKRGYYKTSIVMASLVNGPDDKDNFREEST